MKFCKYANLFLIIFIIIYIFFLLYSLHVYGIFILISKMFYNFILIYEVIMLVGFYYLLTNDFMLLNIR